MMTMMAIDGGPASRELVRARSGVTDGGGGLVRRSRW